MNIRKVSEIIKDYKKHFKRINFLEIYKWRAVKCFHENWNIDAPNFYSMLDKSLHNAKNLLDSQQYYPKRMLLNIAEKRPKALRKLFIDLYNEDLDLIERIKNFKNGANSLTEKFYPDENSYQDLRAIAVYLCFKYPDRYFLYKTKMFKQFAELIDYPYQPIKGRAENVTQYLNLCNLLKAEIIKDNELLSLHQTRLTNKEYPDTALNLLTQDIIYAATNHLVKLPKSGKQTPALKRLKKVNKKVSPKKADAVLKGTFTNYIENGKEFKILGDFGELLVFQHEQEKLKSLGIKKQPEHKSKTQGDGLGYDILSYDENEDEMFIEVKTTRSNSATPFYITNNELLRSRRNTGNFYLYRLYEYDDKTCSAKYFEMKGDLSNICENPILYKAVVSNVKELEHQDIIG